jgi:uncharacterized lipoprotein YmbA
MKFRFLLWFIVLFSAACGTGGRSYYLLTADGPAPSGGGRGIGIGPVVLAEYVDRPNLVMAEDGNRLGIAEDHRWAGDLSSSISRVTAANLGRRLGTGNVRQYPWRGDEGLDVQVVVEIRQFHGTADGNAVIEAGWRAYALPGRGLRASRTFVDSEPLAGDGYGELAAAQSRLLSRLADDIAAGLRMRR